MPIGQRVITNQANRGAWQHVARRAAIWALVAVAPLGQVTAANPFSRLIVFNRPEADPHKAYTLVDTNGPWMILAVTFSGEEAAEQAEELVLELRKRFKLPAYAHRKKFDYSGKVDGNGINQFGDPMPMRYRRSEEIEEIAVLVGDFASVDDADAQRTLKKIKYIEPECLKISEGKKVSRPLAALRLLQRSVEPGFIDEQKSGYVNNVKRGRGPLGSAFLVTNPLLPREYFVPGGLDPFVFELNERVKKYGLLDCPGKYSVKVATFTGNVVFDPKKISSIEKNPAKMPSRLAEAAEAAHNLTVALRRKGVEAYEFHDRTASMVTVGSFDSVGNRLPDGTYQASPAVLMIMETYGAEKSLQPGQAAPTVGKPKSLGGIMFDVQPLPIEVPRQSISAQYAQPTLGMR